MEAEAVLPFCSGYTQVICWVPASPMVYLNRSFFNITFLIKEGKSRFFFLRGEDDADDLRVEGEVSVPFYSGCYYGFLPARMDVPDSTFDFSWGFPKRLSPNLTWKEVHDVKISEVLL